MDARPRERDLTLVEKQFLLACERGDLATVRQHVRQHVAAAAKASAVGDFAATSTATFNVNCVDPLGRTALRIAIENENIDIIETLLDGGAELGDSLLHAINEDNVEAVELILSHLEKQDRFDAEVSGKLSQALSSLILEILQSNKINYH